MLELESNAEAEYNDACPSFLGGVASILKEMVSKSVSEIEAKPEIQKLSMVIHKSVTGAANEGTTIGTYQPSCLAGTRAKEHRRLLIRLSDTSANAWHIFPVMEDIRLLMIAPPSKTSPRQSIIVVIQAFCVRYWTYVIHTRQRNSAPRFLGSFEGFSGLSPALRSRNMEKMH
ncbi:hypothetical protein M758_6G051900 [Ceratodon purpureus]|uniref:Uncharacterized protein n=1 Tax=Ceratodon purpureus TaxID=3225 RepID=A0A8T0HFD5_CERPU|nr:hypothetical protein KC19_6G054700 [Ceratodon purpureus]KAG0612784.1 hypothetical protein M758_6G051900 [Ceratodon purpureus]